MIHSVGLSLASKG